MCLLSCHIQIPNSINILKSFETIHRNSKHLLFEYHFPLFTSLKLRFHTLITKYSHSMRGMCSRQKFKASAEGQIKTREYYSKRKNPTRKEDSKSLWPPAGWISTWGRSSAAYNSGISSETVPFNLSLAFLESAILYNHFGNHSCPSLHFSRQQHSPHFTTKNKKERFWTPLIDDHYSRLATTPSR